MKDRTLMDCFSIVVDPRLDRMKRHNLIDILVITVCGVLSGFDDITDIADYAEEKLDWFQTFLELPNGIPSHDTFCRVLSLIDAKSFQDAFMQWLSAIQPEISGREIISVDGKFLRASLKKSGQSSSAVAIVSAWAHESGLCLGQQKYENKKSQGERNAMAKLVDKLYLKGCIVTLDAGGATPQVAQKIIERNGDYLIGLKNNQETILNFAEQAFTKYKKSTASFKTEEKSHGRIEVREYEQITLNKIDLSEIPEKVLNILIHKWPDLGSLIKVQSSRKAIRGESKEIRYYMSSLRTDVVEIARAIRAHWGVENQLHHVLDVTFKEDQSRVRLKNAAENLALVRRMAINMLKKQDPKLSFKRKRNRCNWSNEYLEQTLWAQIEN